MAKSIIKEIVIILLLLLAILLALGIIFYDYIPTNKVVPVVENYETSQTIKDELNESITDDETVLVTHEVTAGDLKTYEKTNQYKKGKANPFSSYIEETSDENTVVGDGTSISTTPQSNSTKSSTFYGETGTK